MPGSHRRWDTLEELAIRKELNGKTNTEEMPLGYKIRLQPGDAVFFDGYSIHRGNYLCERSRRMLAMLYGSPVDWHNPASYLAIESKAIACLAPHQQALFQHLI